MLSRFTSILDAARSEDMKRAADLLRAGGLVAFPTETVYGLGALGLDIQAVQSIFTAKGRPSNNPLILHVANSKEALSLFKLNEISRRRFDLLSPSFWPGPLTMVCEKSENVPSVTTAGSNKVAVRVPSHSIALKLIKKVGQPLAAPSANVSGRPSATTAQMVLKTLDGKIDAVLNAGQCAHGLESTVVDISGEYPTILRTGAISIATIKAILPDLQVRPIGLACHESIGSPGLSAKHYAPEVRSLRLVSDSELADNWQLPYMMLIKSDTFAQLTERLGKREPKLCEILPSDPINYGQELYAALYRLENTPHIDVLIETPPHIDEWLTIHDRLHRMCAKD